MALNALTTGYLDEIARRGVAASELVELGHRLVDLPATTYLGRCLTRPVFLARDALDGFSTDLIRLHGALTSLPERLFGGDVAAFARAVGMTAAQADAIGRGTVSRTTMLGRADVYQDPDGFKVMELNMGSTIGGLDNALLNRAFLAHPVVAEFVAARKLTYLDTMAEMVDTLRAECGIAEGDSPLIVAADWPESFATLEPQLRYSAEQLAPYGLEVLACHVGQLSVHDGRVWLDGRPVDVIYRVFMMEDMLSAEGPELLDPVLRAVERDEVKIFAPMDAELYGSKGALALVSDEANRHLFSDDELASLDRILPWTRMVRPGPVTLAGGEQADLTEYALANAGELILKPVFMHGGQGVLPGWTATRQDWQEQLKAAVDAPFVLQQRVHPVPEPFPAEDGQRPWVLSWGTFLCASGYGGAIVRGSTDLAGGVLTMARGATATCCFHESTG